MQVKCPNLGDGIQSASVLSILVSIGDKITEGQTLAEVETDKAVAPIPSSQSGIIEKILISIGDTVKTGSPILELSGGASEAHTTEKEEPKTNTPISSEKIPQTTQTTILPKTTYQMSGKEHGPTSPSIKKASVRFGIDLSRIQGTGSGSRITEEDIKNYLSYVQEKAFSEESISKETTKEESAKQNSLNLGLNIDFSKWGDVKVEKASNLRRKISEKLRNTWNMAPHVTQFDEADITDLMDLRKDYKDKYLKKGASLTVTILIIKAMVEALKEFPIFNTSFDEETGEIFYKNYYHIGCAVDTEKGLLVPVIKDVDKKSILELCKEVSILSEKAKNRSIGIEDMQGGTFTVSNLGSLGVGHFTPLINHPEVAILGVGKGDFKVKIGTDKKAKSKLVLPLALSYDHRVIDGADGARFTRKIINTLENFDVALLNEGLGE